MKNSFIILFSIVIFVACKETASLKPLLDAENRIVDMGAIHFDSVYKIKYVLKNSGQADLLIDTVTSSCGCTVPQLSKKLIKPSDTASISVTYKPVDPGEFNKSLVVKSNIDSVFTVLTFKGSTIK